MATTLNGEKDCPLLTDDLELVDRYNDVASLLSEVELKAPKLWQQLPEMARLAAESELRRIRDLEKHKSAERKTDILVRLADIELLLRRERYRVGFVGRSQAAKSSTINEVLGLTILPEGSGRACTNVVTRIHFVSDDQPPSLVLRYMTQDEFRNRVIFLGGDDRLDWLSETDYDSSTKKQLLSQVQEKFTTGVNGDKRLWAEQLEQLLKAGIKFGDELNNGQPKQERLSYRSIDELETAIPGFVKLLGYGAAPARAALLQEVTVVIPKASLSDTVELIDLPGLGTNNEEHDQLTMACVRQLDGLIVFQSAEQVDNADARRLIEELKFNVGDPQGRVWAAITKMDTIRNQQVLYGSEDSLFHSINQFLIRQVLNAEQVLFLCNTIPQQAREQRLVNGLAEKERAKILNLRVDEHGVTVIPPALFEQFAVFQSAFRQLLADGGHGELRRILESTIADRVREQVCKQIHDGLVDIVEDLTRFLRSAEQRSAMDFKDIKRAAAWSTVAAGLSQEIDGQSDMLAGEASVLYDLLWNDLEDLAAPETLNHQDSLREFHSMVANVLHREGVGQVKADDGTFVRMSERVASRFRELASSKATLIDANGNLVNPPELDPVNEFVDRSHKDLSQFDEWGVEADFQSFRRTKLFDTPNGADGLDSGGYRRVLEQKLDAVVYQVVHRIANRLRLHADELHRELRLLGQPRDESEDYGDAAVFRTLRAHAESVLEQLKKTPFRGA